MSILDTFAATFFSGIKDVHKPGLLLWPNNFFIQCDTEKLFSNGGSRNKINKESQNNAEEIRDESGLGSGAGTTSNDQSTFTGRRFTSEDEEAIDEDAGATGPGSNRDGSRMPGEQGVTDVTDGIARFIDDLEEDDSDKEDSSR